MAEPLATAVFLDELRSLYPPTSAVNPWYIVAAVGFAASNRPEEVPAVFKHALQDLQTHDEKLLLARRLRDALFKGGMLTGYNKAINALLELKNACPPELLDTEIQRDINLHLKDLENEGNILYPQQYGETAEQVQTLLDSIYPDMGYFSRTIAYGFVYRFKKYMTDAEMSFVLVTALIAGDTPKQIGWHLAGAKRNGATQEEVRAIRAMAIKVADMAGIHRRHEVPEV